MCCRRVGTLTQVEAKLGGTGEAGAEGGGKDAASGGVAIDWQKELAQ